MKLLALAASALFLAACQQPSTKTKSSDLNASNDQSNDIVKLTLLHTNDNHGRFWQNRNGEYGMAARKTLIDQIRAEVSANGGKVLLLSGGDINTGVPESDLLDAEPDFKGMSMIGYDAMAVGNHEFDNSRAVLEKQQQWANFPFLSANIYDQSTQKRLFQPYETFKVAELEVAVVGFTTEDTVKIGNPEFMVGLEFKSPVEEAQQLIPELNRIADIVIAVTHMGHYTNGAHKGNAPGDVTLARSVNGIDVIIGGHSQVPLFKPDVQNGTLIVQAHEWGKYVGRLDLEIKGDQIVKSDYKLIPVNLKNKVKDSEGNSTYVLKETLIQENVQMVELLKPYQEQGGESLNQIIGQSNGKWVGDRSQVRVKPTNLGRLIATAQMEKANADVAIMNSGGIRADIESGDITYKDVLTVQPFGNILAFVDLTGAELLEYLNAAIAKESGSGAFAQFSGVEIMATNGVINLVTVGSKSIKLEDNYRLAINSFIASGGDGYPKLSDHQNFVNTGFSDADLLVEYIQKNSPLDVASYSPGNLIDRL